MIEDFFKGLMKKWLYERFNTVEDRLMIARLELDDLKSLMELEHPQGVNGFWKECGLYEEVEI